MRVLIDTNVIIDAIVNRGEDTRRARLLVRKHEEKRFRGHVSASAITDVYYIVEKERKHDFALAATQKVVRMLTVIPVDFEIIQTALNSLPLDFEDAVQAMAAKEYGLDTVVTRDKKGFRDCGLRVYSPEEFLEAMER